jgi:hypothetical protein
MIDPKELRLWNKVKCTISNDAGIYQVLAMPMWGIDGIGDGTDPQILIDRCPKQLVTPHQLKAIPLTEDWLIKFGFKQDFIYKYRWSIDGFVVHLMLVSLNSKKEAYHLALDYGQLLTSPIFSVHKLQNLYFALTGKELAILL